MELNGVFTQANTATSDFKEELKNKNATFLINSAHDSRFNNDKFYTIVTCSGKEDGEYTVFLR